MVLSKLPRNPAMDGIDLFRRLDRFDEGALAEPSRIEAVVNEIRDQLMNGLATESTVRGWRAQALFASLVTALDSCELMTFVDTGDIYFEGDSVKAPDYFLHLRGGRRILVDVKNVELQSPHDLDQPVKLSASEDARLRRFATLFGAELYIAVYYSGIPMWCLVPIDRFHAGPGGGRRVTVRETILWNEISVLGDHLIGTLPRLECIVTTNQLAAKRGGPNEVTYEIEIQAVEYEVDGKSIVSDEARGIVHFLMLYGDWPDAETPVVVDGRLEAIRFLALPPEDSGQGFEIIGSLSSMYSRMFESTTSDARGMSKALDLDILPGSLVTLIPHSFQSDELPLWRFFATPEKS